jgi:hypothetical protein
LCRKIAFISWTQLDSEFSYFSKKEGDLNYLAGVNCKKSLFSNKVKINVWAITDEVVYAIEQGENLLDKNHSIKPDFVVKVKGSRKKLINKIKTKMIETLTEKGIPFGYNPEQCWY